MERLKNLRSEIDEIDRAILSLLEERMGVIRQIGQLKKKEGFPAVDSKRHDEHVKELLTAAKKLEISSDMVKELYEVIHEYSVKEQGGQ
jgi:chorismate mutase